MSGTVSPWFREQILNYIFRGENLLGSELKVCLTRRVPAANADPAGLDEPPASAGYARVSYPYGAIQWELNGFGEVVTANEIVFPAPTTTWGTITGWALVSADATQTCAVGSMVTPLRVEFGQLAVVRAGGIAFGLTD